MPASRIVSFSIEKITNSNTEKITLSEEAVIPEFKGLQHEVWICGPYSNSILTTTKL